MNMEETDELSKADESVVAETGHDSKANVKVLISPERAQQFQLLIHLISNRLQPLVLSGPEGIGKTTMLNLLQERKADSWQVCTIEASASLDLERIQQLLVRSAEKKDTDLQGRELVEILTHYDKSRQKLVLVIDEAGMLAPGMIGELCKLTESYPVLRIVFALTPDQLHVINSSDKSINDCFFIEFPTLTEKQCGDFLQNLSCKPGAAVKVNAINPEMIENLYRETHGIPGQIVKAFSGNSRFSSPENETSTSSFVLGAILIAVVASFVWWNGASDTDQGRGSSISGNESVETIAAPSFINPGREKIETRVIIAEQKTTSEQPLTDEAQFAGKTGEGQVKEFVDPESKLVTETIAPVIAASVEQVQDKAPLVKEGSEKTASLTNVEYKTITPVSEMDLSDEQVTNKAANMNAAGESTIPVATREITVSNVENKSVEKDESQQSDNSQTLENKLSAQDQNALKAPATKEIEGTVSSDANVQWVLQQPPTNFTLQLMVLSRLDSLEKVKQEYPMLQQDFRSFKMTKSGKTKYYVLYGSFDSRAETVRTMQALPKELQQAWMRKFSGLQNKIRSESVN